MLQQRSALWEPGSIRETIRRQETQAEGGNGSRRARLILGRQVAFQVPLRSRLNPVKRPGEGEPGGRRCDKISKVKYWKPFVELTKDLFVNFLLTNKSFSLQHQPQHLN